MKKERDIFDLIKEAQEDIGKPEDPVTRGNEILFGKDGKPVNHYRCNICGYLFKENKILNDEETGVGFVCKGCKGGMEDLDREQEGAEELATLIREEKNSKCF